MKVLVTGGSGALGSEIAKLIPGALVPTHSELDLTSDVAVASYLSKNRPEVIIHCAALTDVRVCENERERAWSNNVTATENLVTWCEGLTESVYFVHISTACVFRGDKGNYTEEDLPYPDNFYSLTKLLSEFVVRRLSRHLVVRTNFVPRKRWKYRRAFTDRYGTYLFADDAARAILEVASQNITGTLHIAGDRKLSMFDLARITTPDVEPMTMKDVDLPVPRDMSLISKRTHLFKLTF